MATFMGGLKPEIANGIQMFKPTNLKDATSLARMRDDQLNRLSPITQASSVGPTKNTTSSSLGTRCKRKWLKVYVLIVIKNSPWVTSAKDHNYWLWIVHDMQPGI